MGKKITHSTAIFFVSLLWLAATIIACFAVHGTPLWKDNATFLFINFTLSSICIMFAALIGSDTEQH